jgi:hypothetical protein
MVMASPNAFGQVTELPVDMRRSLSSVMHSVGLQVDRHRAPPPRRSPPR